MNPKILKLTLSILAVLALAAGVYLYRIHAKRQAWRAQQEFCTAFSLSSDQDHSCAIHPVLTDSGYVFVIPAYWDLDRIQAKYDSRYNKTIELSNQLINASWNYLAIKSGETMPCNISGEKQNPRNVLFFKSKVNAIFISTESGSFQAIDNSKDKSHSEKGEILIVSDSGHIEYQGPLSSIHGRGNMTWNLMKKPYSIKLDEKASILGLKEAKKFNLLANMCDETSLRNWIMLNTAQEIGVPFAIHSAFVSLYKNGQYAGLYQITNKVDLSTSGIDITDLEKKTKKINATKLKKCERFNIDRGDTLGFKKGIIANNPSNITGGYILESNFKLHRYTDEISGFIPSFGYPIVIKAPEYATKEQVEYISNYFEEMMIAIRSKDGINPSTRKHYSDYIDIDSFIYYYLCSEVFYNLDAVFASFIMFKDIDDKLHCGPVWDYDLSLNTKVYFDKANGYNSLYVREAREKDGSRMIFGQLYQHPDYKKRMVEIFNLTFLPVLKRYCEGQTLDSIHQLIDTDLYCNDLLWQKEYDRIYHVLHRDTEWNESAQAQYQEIEEKGDYWNIKRFLQQRSSFLSILWADTKAEQECRDILWDFGKEELFEHTSTRIAFPTPKGEQFSWPRYLIKNKQIQLANILDTDGNAIDINGHADSYTLKYDSISPQK